MHDTDDAPVADHGYGIIDEIATTLRVIMALLAAILIVLTFSVVRANAGNWWDRQHLTDATQKRLGVQWDSCCDHGDACKTCQFRVEQKAPYRDEWWYKNGNGDWKHVPPDEVHVVDWTPTGGVVLFLYPYESNDFIKRGDPVCLKIPRPRT